MAVTEKKRQEIADMAKRHYEIKGSPEKACVEMILSYPNRVEMAFGCYIVGILHSESIKQAIARKWEDK
ncbi:MAG: hypothetical protein PHY56_06255 [Candidatus Omnitrophica bacterium]|jgi:hypothetical protein|nr:hypothetical protein [Candidatus Omnitrophota bacterium]